MAPIIPHHAPHGETGHHRTVTDVLLADPGGGEVPLTTQIAGPPLSPGEGVIIHSGDLPAFESTAKGEQRVTVRATIEDPEADPDPTPENNEMSVDFMVENKAEEPWLSVEIWNWFNDTFPFNRNSGLLYLKEAFDTTAALIRTGLNIASPLGPIAGDSVVIEGSPGTARVDMLFRVLPGPGNYEPIGQGHSGNLRRVPSDPATVTPYDGSWWDVYRRIPGEFSTNPAGMFDLKAGWDANFWLSARCDLAQLDLMTLPSAPSSGPGMFVGPPNPSAWMTTYHPADPRYDLLGIEKPICFEIFDLDGGQCVPTGEIDCSAADPGPCYTNTSTTTKRFTKIIPDGLLTPGSHVEYFFRSQMSSKEPGPLSAMVPDTNMVSPQTNEGPSTDGHRWQEFSVLPDRWKDPQYLHPVTQTYGHGPACLLVLDYCDRRGNERVWVSVADTIGATEPLKWAAHNGWHASGDQDVNDPAARGYLHGGHPGTNWDLYQVKGAESPTMCAGGVGSSQGGPTLGMLNRFYSLILILSGDLNTGILGPYPGRPQNDVQILMEWLASGSPLAPDRGIWTIGEGLVEDLETSGSLQQNFLHEYLRVSLHDPSYRLLSGDMDPVIDFHVFPEWQGKQADVEIYGMRNHGDSDVLTPLAPAVPTSEYQSKSAPSGGPYYAGSLKDWDPSMPWVALVEGWNIENLTTRNDPNTVGRHMYFNKVFATLWSGKAMCSIPSDPMIPLDVPGFDDVGFVNWLNVRNNPVTAGQATIHLELAKADRVTVDIYDVAGRLVRTLWSGELDAGAHDVVWDGHDGAGQRLGRGVYFTRVKYRDQNFVSAKKVTLLR